MMSDLDNLLNQTPTKKAKPAKSAKPAKTEAKPAKSAKPAKTEAKPKRVIDANVSMTQPDDSIVLKAVRKLKEATLAAGFAHDLGVHRRVIRAQLQRLAKDKANGVKMVKDGAHWLVSNTAK